MSININALKILLPCFELTEVTTEFDCEATKVTIPIPENSECITYHMKTKCSGSNGLQRDGKPNWSNTQYNSFPVVLDSTGVPWAEAEVYILLILEGVTDPTMSTYSSIADDLSAFRKFLDENELDWTHFPSKKLERPTYRYNGHLKFAVSAEEISPSTARRRMGTVIRFYRWLKDEGVLVPENTPWKESDRYIDYLDKRGFNRKKTVITTDISINIPKQFDPYDGTIDDGGKLRPLPLEEQDWLMDALFSLGNTEMMLIHLFGMLTAARIQSILTFRVYHFASKLDEGQKEDLRVPIGFGTDIDTKKNKQSVLFIPIWFYEMLHTYVHSKRAKKRRGRAIGGDNENQYLFLSVRGAPLYQCKKEARTFNKTSKSRYLNTGSAVRTFITEYVIPFVKNKYSKSFHYRFHDTRATAGMNWTDRQLQLVKQGKTTLSKAREFVQIRMGHDSFVTTERYLQFRQNRLMVRWVSEEYEHHLKILAQRAMEGLL